jgi:DNA-binding cell septation regulator SpoVG
MQLEQPKNTDLVIGYLLENCKPKVKISTKPNVLASVDVDFHVMKIKGFMVREKDGKLWVNPPSRPAPPPHKWPRIFWSENPDFWNKLSEKILEAYNLQKSEGKTWEQIAEGIEY